MMVHAVVPNEKAKRFKKINRQSVIILVFQIPLTPTLRFLLYQSTILTGMRAPNPNIIS